MGGLAVIGDNELYEAEEVVQVVLDDEQAREQYRQRMFKLYCDIERAYSHDKDWQALRKAVRS